MKKQLELFIVVDHNGDYETAPSLDLAKERHADNIGPLEESEGFRVLRLNVSIPIPELIDATAEIADEEAVTVS